MREHRIDLKAKSLEPSAPAECRLRWPEVTPRGSDASLEHRARVPSTRCSRVREPNLDIPREIHAKSTRGPRKLAAVVARRFTHCCRFTPASTVSFTIIVDDRNSNDANHDASVSIFVCVTKTRRADRSRALQDSRGWYLRRLVPRWYLA